jgi:hypothetical protein
VRALDLGKRKVIPADRALAMAIGVAAQFELLLRQKDIIGDWGGARGARSGPATLRGRISPAGAGA